MGKCKIQRRAMQSDCIFLGFPWSCFRSLVLVGCLSPLSICHYRTLALPLALHVCCCGPPYSLVFHTINRGRKNEGPKFSHPSLILSPMYTPQSPPQRVCRGRSHACTHPPTTKPLPQIFAPTHYKALLPPNSCWYKGAATQKQGLLKPLVCRILSHSPKPATHPSPSPHSNPVPNHIRQSHPLPPHPSPLVSSHHHNTRGRLPPDTAHNTTPGRHASGAGPPPATAAARGRGPRARRSPFRTAH